MVKIILEYTDIEKLIKEKYPNSTIKGGLLKDMEITIQMDELTNNEFVHRKIPPVIIQKPAKKEVLLPDGTIDAKASGLTLESNGVPQRRLSGIL